MSFEKILRYTGAYGQGKSVQPKELKIDGDCTIANYNILDPKYKNSKPAGAYVKVEAYNSVFVQEGAKYDNTPDVADFSAKKAKMLEIIARDGVLSKDDIYEITPEQKAVNINKWNKEFDLGITDYKVDHNNVVITVKWGENDVLRIDFSNMAKDSAIGGKNNSVQQTQTKQVEAKAVAQENQQAETKNVPEVHEVKQGETLSKITQKYGLSLAAVLKLNPGLKPDMIKEGQVIKLRAPQNSKKHSRSNINPEGVNAPVYYKGDYPTEHTIKKGQTLDSIADQYQLFTRELKEANPKYNARSLPVGAVLIIPEPQKLKGLNNISKSGQKFLSRLRDLESGAHGYYAASNAFGYKGAYQMGKAALKDIGVYYEATGRYSNSTQKDAEWKGVFIEGNLFGITSIEDFLNNPKKQDKAIIRYMQLTWKFIEDNGMNEYVGKTIAGVKVTETGLIAACHLVGRNKVEKFLSSEGTYIPTDGNNPPTPVTKYLGDTDLMGENRDFKF